MLLAHEAILALFLLLLSCFPNFIVLFFLYLVHNGQLKKSMTEERATSCRIAGTCSLSICCFSWQNIHLVAKWLAKLEKTLEQYSVGSNESYRVYMSAEPTPSSESYIIPQV